MSPEIKINDLLIADVPDETGWHRALNGSPLYVGVDGINVEKDSKDHQIMILGSRMFGRERAIGLKLNGKGSSEDTKRGGDGKEPAIQVVLKERPIRRGKYHNHRWMKK